MKKEFYDEKIVEVRNQMEQYEEEQEMSEEPVENNIANGYIWIEGRKLEIAEKEAAGHLFILLPDEMEEMDEAVVKVKYPAFQTENHVIFTNEDTTINFIFDFKDLEMKPEETELVRDTMRNFVMKIHAGSKVLEEGILNTEACPAAYFSFISQSLDKPIYNFMFFFQIEERLVSGTFNCFETEKNLWTDLVKQMISSIQIRKGE